MKIGIFDSGLGGLSILREIIRVLPDYDYIYLGDNARLPYGGRSKNLIYQFTKNAVKFLLKKNCNLVILACNTASSTSLQRIQQEFLTKYYPGRRVLGVIKPAIEALSRTKPHLVGVIGTYATVQSTSFVKEIKKIQAKTQVFQQACPLLVPIIEEGEIDWIGLNMILEKYLKPLKTKEIDVLILGCTHYGLIVDKIRSVIGKKVKIISEGKETATKLKDYLKKHPEIENKLSKEKSREFYVTDLNLRYQKMARTFLGKNFKDFTGFTLTSI